MKGRCLVKNIQAPDLNGNGLFSGLPDLSGGGELEKFRRQLVTGPAEVMAKYMREKRSRFLLDKMLAMLGFVLR